MNVIMWYQYNINTLYQVIVDLGIFCSLSRKENWSDIHILADIHTSNWLLCYNVALREQKIALRIFSIWTTIELLDVWY